MSNQEGLGGSGRPATALGAGHLGATTEGREPCAELRS
jgi:hypothetical protein